MDAKRLVKISKYLAKHLRHQPERLSIILEPGGWVLVDELLAACKRNQFPLSKVELETVVAQNDKQRFSFDETRTKIRANQGHSVEIDLQLEPLQPPAVLFHGTKMSAVGSIWQHGILKGSRHHVHLSADAETALNVGKRHGAPVAFVIDAARMNAENYVFYCSANGVWLTDYVPPAYFLSVIEPQD